MEGRPKREVHGPDVAFQTVSISQLFLAKPDLAGLKSHMSSGRQEHTPPTKPRPPSLRRGEMPKLLCGWKVSARSRIL